MCGIAGIIGGNTSLIQPMLESIRHRGPDGLHYWQEPAIAFGHARLSIIDLSSNADQPMKDTASGNMLVFNGEIYNYLEIKAAIGNRYDFKNDSDSEVILAAYVVYGIEFLHMLRGMFAFALYDKQQNKTLVVRDRFGIKPFYYRQDNEGFYFASEIKALLRQQESINSFKVYEFLANCQLDTNEETFFEGVLQLHPAHYAWVDAAGKMSEQVMYWDFPSPGKKKFDANAAEEFVSLFSQTINLHLRSDVPVGTFLSGGIDSTSVTCFAAAQIERPELHTFSGILPYYHPENALIEGVLQGNSKLKPHKFPLDGKDFFKDMPSVIYHHDEPVMDGSMYAHYKLCQLANENKIKVLLSGSGGDELFGGYASYIHAHHATLLKGLKIVSYLKDVKKFSKMGTYSASHLLIKSMYETIPQSLRTIIKNRSLQKKIKHVLQEEKVPHYYHQHRNPYFANLVNNYRSWTAPPFLHYEDRNSMAFGVETRVPFFDHVLIEFVLQFATEEIITGRTKSVMRNAFRGKVPDEVLDQKGKYGFPSPIDHALRTDERGRELFYSHVKETPFLEEKETLALADNFYNNNGDVSIYWRTLSYVLWYQIFFKKNLVQPGNG